MAAYSENISFDAVKPYILPFVLGATIVHSAACVLSDIYDIDFDRQVGQYHPFHSNPKTRK